MPRTMDDAPYPPKTSMPDWPAEPGRLDPAAVSYTLFSLGEADKAVLRRWARTLEDAAVPHDAVVVDTRYLAAWIEDLPQTMVTLAAGRRVGWRIAAAGEESAVLAVAAAAREAGLLDVELTLFVTDSRRIRVYCPHCKSHTLAEARPGSVVRCSGCALDLEVHPHLSLHTGMYLGTDRAARERRRVRQSRTPDLQEALHG
ncbi:dimethylamine monooxygenase subunit DmmA family protein [Arthrobacter mangrovi]|uniref:Dimethylamine monooxygenase subunit DmmA-like C-terminal domain-containing protein n=1 Tax=Arthrobacter mangrovi TaxID=2966350 RepID=A0ABQ5MPQ9_9MICC|nr:dimethylamine monooxygenase subunit DmmA family protein [Arthrobacter mangrovi]GLB65968.1 hypothetical protein AHIS1636_04070 [Arthrobacter mangrovi]